MMQIGRIMALLSLGLLWSSATPAQDLSLTTSGRHLPVTPITEPAPTQPVVTPIVVTTPDPVTAPTPVVVTPVIAPAAPTATASGNLSAVWANEGGDKVTQDELRASTKKENLTGTVINRTWDGSTILLSGARNEVVSFNLVLEAANTTANGVSVSFDALTGPNGVKIANDRQAVGDDVFNWVGRPIELFYTRYLQIKGLSAFGWYHGDERQLPVRFQRPNVAGAGLGFWTDRPDHDKFYPDILVPLEIVPSFTVAAGQNQSIWSDVYIPKGATPGTYTGSVLVKENGAVTRVIPVSLTVQAFALPDVPSIKGLTFLDSGEISKRMKRPGYINWQTQDGQQVKHIVDVYWQLFHRHRLDLFGGETEAPGVVGIHPLFTPRYDGSLYTAANGYDGPGAGVGNTIYGVGPYGSWNRDIYDEATMWRLADPLGDWFAKNFPNLTYFVYLMDEPDPSNFQKIQNWSKWLDEDPGNGHNMLSMSTIGLNATNSFIPSLKIPAAANMMGECPTTSPNNCDNVAFTSNALATLLAKPNRRYWEYGGGHPGSGTTNTEDDGIALRTWPWIQAKLGVDRWFSWIANLDGPMDHMQQACTWACDNLWFDPFWGQQSIGAPYTNGNGILVYAGTDSANPMDSYGLNGPLASVRLKEWRRGTEDADYLTIARQIDPVQTAAIIKKVIPAVLWENKAPGWPNGDPSYFQGPVSWSSNPDDWESARAQLAGIINQACTANPSAAYCK